MPKVVAARTPREAEKLLRHCLEEGAVIPGRHFREELAAEGLDFLDVLPVLGRGSIFAPPEMDVRTREWKYRIEGYEESGKWLAIVFCFKAVATAFLITVFSVESRRHRGR